MKSTVSGTARWIVILIYHTIFFLEKMYCLFCWCCLFLSQIQYQTVYPQVHLCPDYRHYSWSLVKILATTSVLYLTCNEVYPTFWLFLSVEIFPPLMTGSLYSWVIASCLTLQNWWPPTLFFSLPPFRKVFVFFSLNAACSVNGGEGFCCILWKQCKEFSDLRSRKKVVGGCQDFFNVL